MSKELGARIRAARNARGMTIKQMADALGVTYPAAQQWEVGKTSPTAENLLAVSALLGTSLSEGDGAADPMNAGPNAIWEPGPITITKPPLGPLDIEELGVTVGGDGEDDAAFEMNGQTVDWVRRPPGISGRQNVFALRVTNSSMEPKYDDGERIFVERRRPAVRDFCVIELHPLAEGRPGKSFIKRLVAMDSSGYVVEQYNPKGILEFGRHEVKNLFRVIPEKELRGEA